jgi:hypothetical protein
MESRFLVLQKVYLVYCGVMRNDNKNSEVKMMRMSLEETTERIKRQGKNVNHDGSKGSITTLEGIDVSWDVTGGKFIINGTDYSQWKWTENGLTFRELGYEEQMKVLMDIMTWKNEQNKEVN